MKRIFKVLLITQVSIGFAFAQNIQDAQSYQNEIQQLREQKNSVILKNRSLNIKVKMRNFNKKEKAKLFKGIEVLSAVINSNEFKEKVHNHMFRGERTFNENNDMTNEEIYDHLMTGAEILKPDVDYTMDFDVTMYWSWNPFSKVKGYTKPNTMRIWLHKKFYRKKSWTPIDVAANLGHEWVHKMGFGHAYRHNEDRPFTVPYAIGGIIAEVAENMGF